MKKLTLRRRRNYLPLTAQGPTGTKEKIRKDSFRIFLYFCGQFRKLFPGESFRSKGRKDQNKMSDEIGQKSIDICVGGF